MTGNVAVIDRRTIKLTRPNSQCATAPTPCHIRRSLPIGLGVFMGTPSMGASKVRSIGKDVVNVFSLVNNAVALGYTLFHYQLNRGSSVTISAVGEKFVFRFIGGLK